MAAKQLTKSSNNENTKIDDIDIEPINETGDPDVKRKKREKKKKSSKGIFSKLVPILVLMLVIGSLIAILGFNLFNIRDKYLSGILKNIPIVNNLLPAETSTDSGDPYGSMTNDELIAQINTLTNELEKSQQTNQDLANTNSLYTSEISRLKGFESQQLQYKNDKAAFDKMIAEGNPSAYASFYENISPENAAELYQKTISDIQYTKDLKKYVANFSAMDSKSAAAALEQMITTDMSLVVLILQNMTSETVGAIQENMEPKNVASIAKMMLPTPVPEMTPTPAATILDTSPEPTATP